MRGATGDTERESWSRVWFGLGFICAVMGCEKGTGEGDVSSGPTATVSSGSGSGSSGGSGTPAECSAVETLSECEELGCVGLAAHETFFDPSVGCTSEAGVAWCDPEPRFFVTHPGSWYEVASGRVFFFPNDPIGEREGWLPCTCAPGEPAGCLECARECAGMDGGSSSGSASASGGSCLRGGDQTKEGTTCN